MSRTFEQWLETIPEEERETLCLKDAWDACASGIMEVLTTAQRLQAELERQSALIGTLQNQVHSLTVAAKRIQVS